MGSGSGREIRKAKWILHWSFNDRMQPTPHLSALVQQFLGQAGRFASWQRRIQVHVRLEQLVLGPLR